MELQKLDLMSQMSKNKNPRECGSLELAYLGDCVFEIYVRTYIFNNNYTNVNKMDKHSRNLVKAKSQAIFYHKIIEHLTVEELSVLKRGRNAKSYTKAKNASVLDYRHATGLEALFGFLYLDNKIDRLDELFGFIIEEDKKDGK